VDEQPADGSVRKAASTGARRRKCAPDTGSLDQRRTADADPCEPKRKSVLGIAGIGAGAE